jgi:DNA-binding response OmpR family regulator
MRVLLVEDESLAAQIVAKGLRENSYAVDVADDGHRALDLANDYDYDAIVLDVLLPGIDGFALCKEVRRQHPRVPVLMLTARDDVEARIMGLDSGADDYLTKPFDFGELLARLRAIIRRGQLPPRPEEIRFGHLRLNLRARQVFVHNEAITLTSREYALLEYLVLHAGQIVGRRAIAEHVWNESLESMSNVIDVLIQRLRRKIDLPDGPSLISTRRGEGYVFSAAGALG